MTITCFQLGQVKMIDNSRVITLPLASSVMSQAPRGLWYCPPCIIERPILRSRTNNPSHTLSLSTSARRGRNNPRPNYDPWERVWLTVGGRYESLEAAYSTNNDDDEPLDPSEQDIDAWNRRIDVARRQGGAQVLHEAVPRILERLPFIHQEPEMTEDEKTAWAMLEEAEGNLLTGASPEPMERETQEEQAESSAAASKKRRLSKLFTSSPQTERKSAGDIDSQNIPPESPSEPAPERKLKRPRTRRNVPPPLANPESPIEAQPQKPSADAIEAANSPPANREPAPVPAPSSPTLLDTLLADIDKPQPANTAGLKFPRPISSNRPAFLPPSSPLTPPMDTPESSPASPILEHPHEVTLTLPHSPPAEPSSPPPRQDSASPSGLSLTNKKEIEKLVRSVLAPYYQAGDMSSDQFAEINKSVSRSLYSKIGDGRIREWEKGRWQTLAKKEVDKLVEQLRGSTA
ncbi:hypothetical protein TWF694_000574 [Orbilia ellipsospora]|uniref:Uncharacterized protein n=1 Tax=Orbilia ellipsospora TaxID=2528407 RepID=A0AAV9XSD3_9PEZI